MQLKELQKHFYHAIQKQEISEELLELIDSTKELSEYERLQIYKDSVYGARYELLCEVYPAVKFYLAGRFEEIAVECIPAFPSISESIDDYAYHFITFLKQYDSELPYVYELALFELQYYELFFSKDVLLINQDAFATAVENCPEKIIFYMPDSSFLIDSKFPLLSLWECAYGFSDNAPDMKESCKCIAIRIADEVYFCGLSDDDLWFLKAVDDGLTMDELCEELGDDMMEMLPHAIENHWIDRFSLGE